MSIQGTWEDKANNIYRAEFPRGWTWDDYHIFLDSLPEQVEDSEQALHMIIVYLAGAGMPKGSPRPHHGRSAKILKLGVTVSVTEDAIVIAYVRQSQRMLKRQENIDFTFRKTVEEANQFIIQQIQNSQPENPDSSS